MKLGSVGALMTPSALYPPKAVPLVYICQAFLKLLNLSRSACGTLGSSTTSIQAMVFTSAQGPEGATVLVPQLTRGPISFSSPIIGLRDPYEDPGKFLTLSTVKFVRWPQKAISSIWKVVPLKKSRG